MERCMDRPPNGHWEPQSPATQRPRWLYLRILFSRWNIALGMLIFFLWMNADYEDRLYGVFVAGVVTPEMTPEQKMLALMSRVYRVVEDRSPIFAEDTLGGPVCLRTIWLHSGDTRLLQANEACGSNAGIFVEACQQAGLPARVCQMTRENASVHILSEVQVDGKWVVADPTFNQVFRTPSGELASHADVSADWPYYRHQADSGYETGGCMFQGVRYTNWSKVPVLLPAVKGILNWVLGREKADQISLRSYCLNVYRVYLLAAVIVLVGINVARWVGWRWRRSNPDKGRVTRA